VRSPDRGSVAQIELTSADVSDPAAAAAVVPPCGDYCAGSEAKPAGPARQGKVLLDEALLDGFAGMRHGHARTTVGSHGRIETRQTWITDKVNRPGRDLLDQWAGLVLLR
jgi:hypothetical protein